MLATNGMRCGGCTTETDKARAQHGDVRTPNCGGRGSEGGGALRGSHMVRWGGGMKSEREEGAAAPGLRVEMGEPGALRRAPARDRTSSGPWHRPHGMRPMKWATGPTRAAARLALTSPLQSEFSGRNARPGALSAPKTQLVPIVQPENALLSALYVPKVKFSTSCAPPSVIKPIASTKTYERLLQGESQKWKIKSSLQN